MSQPVASAHHELLLSPLRVGSIELRNRVVLSAHVTNLAASDRTATDRHLAYYRERARGGAGLVVIESLAVHPTAGSSRLSMQAFDDSMIEPMARVAAAVRDEGARAVAQLNHGGREHNPLTTGHALWSSSSTASRLRRQTPHVMDRREIAELVGAFAAAAVRLQLSGLDGVEINAGHGYLLHQFMTPLVNHRADGYGGSLAGRTRIVEEVLAAVRAAVGSTFVVGVRISGSEFLDGGIDAEMAAGIAQRLVPAGSIDYVSVSHSTYETLETVVPDMAFGQAPFVDLAATVRRAIAPVPVITAGRISTPEAAEAVLVAGQADLVAMTRAQIADPFLVRKISEGRIQDIRSCVGCNQGCIGYTFQGADISCLQNPAAGFELTDSGEEPPISDTPRRVVVVGGGPAGMEAAWTAAAGGHDVTLLEASHSLGGLLSIVESMPSRADLAGVRTYRERMLDKHGVDVRLGVRATAEDVLALTPDVVIVATGSIPRPGAESSEWAFATDQPGACVVVDADGTMTALTVAEHLARRGATVTLVSAAVPGNAVVAISLKPAQRRLAALGVVQAPLHVVQQRVGGKVELLDVLNATTTWIEADHVVEVSAREALDDLATRLTDSVDHVVLVGDASAPRQAIEAIADGRRAALAIR